MAVPSLVMLRVLSDFAGAVGVGVVMGLVGALLCTGLEEKVPISSGGLPEEVQMVGECVGRVGGGGRGPSWVGGGGGAGLVRTAAGGCGGAVAFMILKIECLFSSATLVVRVVSSSTRAVWLW